MNEIVNVKVEKIDNVLVTTSNRVAEELGVRHDHLLDKIDNYVKLFNPPELSGSFYLPSEYIHPQNKQAYRNYLITEKGVAQLIGGYSAAVPKAFDLNVAYINEFERMKTALSTVKIPTTMKEVLLIALEQEEQIESLKLENKVQKNQIAEDRPKVLFAEAVNASHTSILIGDLAKLLKQNGYNTGQKRLFSILRDKGFLIKSGESKNMPTQRGMELGLFEVKETTVNNPDGSIRVTKTTKVTGKGQQYFITMFLDKVS